MSLTGNMDLDRVGPFVVAGTFLAVIVGLYGGAFLLFGALGVLAGALIGLGWALLFRFISDRLTRRAAWRAELANAPLFLAIIAIRKRRAGHPLSHNDWRPLRDAEVERSVSLVPRSCTILPEGFCVVLSLPIAALTEIR